MIFGTYSFDVVFSPRILGISAENVPPVALQDDRVVEIQGEHMGVHKAVELIATQLRKFLVDRSVLPLFEMQVSCFCFGAWYGNQ